MRALTRWLAMPPALLKGYLKKIYGASGAIRDAQLLLRNLDKEENVPPDFRIWLEAHLLKKKEEWSELYNQKKMNEWRSKVKRYSHKRDSHHVGEKFMNNRSASLESFKTQRPLSDEGIHGGRKAIKDIQFVNNWQNKFYGAVHDDTSAAQMKIVADEAGNYMDVCKKIELLDEYMTSETDEHSLQSAQHLRNKWTNEKQEQRGKVILSLESL